MYLDHYQLKAKPFDLSPKPDFLWLGEKHKEALATLTYGIVEELGFLLLTGDVGVGKTALIHRLFNNIDSSTIVAHITDPGLGTLDFFRLVAIEFNIAADFQSKGEFLIELEKFLHQAHEDRKKVLLVVDEAQRLSNKLLDQIRVLSNIELSDRKLINIFFVGQPEFKKMLMDNNNRAIRQRIAINYHIGPLTESETGDYIEHRLKMAGAARKIFKSGAIHEIFRSTGGFPRAINITCDHALLTGYASGLRTIDSAVIKECEQELSIRAGVEHRRVDGRRPARATPPARQPRAPRRSSFRAFALLTGILVVLSTAAGFYWLWPDLRRTITPHSQPPDPIAADRPKDAASNRQPGPFPANENTADEPSVEEPTVKETAPRSPAAGDEIDATDRRPAIAIAQAPPAPGPIPGEMPPDGAAGSVIGMGPDAAEEGTPTANRVQSVPDDILQYRFEQPEASNPDPEDEAGTTDPPPEVVVAQTQPAPDDPAPDGGSTAAGDQEAAAPPLVTDGSTAELQTDRPGDEVAEQDTAPPEENPTDTEPRPSPPAVQAAAAAETRSDNQATVSVAGAAADSGGGAAAPSTVDPPDAPAVEAEEAAAPSPTDSEMSAATSQPVESTPAKSDSAPEPGSASIDPIPSLAAKTETQLQPPPEPTDGAPSDEATDVIGMEDRLRSFLETYCRTYAQKDLDAFTQFFAEDAVENGKPFDSLLPKYERNFKLLESIQYRIKLQDFSYDDEANVVTVEGDFFLEWLPPDNNWRENSGKIFMRLKESGSSFVVHRLDYYGGNSKAENQ